MAGETRQRLLDSSAELFRRKGYTGTAVKEILAAANAPFGSLYHFFPGGKSELGAETIRTSGRLYMSLFAQIAADAPDPMSAVQDFFDGAAETLRETHYQDACPIATVALEVASTDEALREATAGVFEEWIDGAAAYFAAHGADGDTSRGLALSMLSLLEGAFIFCRALRTVEPIHEAGRCAAAAVGRALASGPAASEASRVGG